MRLGNLEYFCNCLLKDLKEHITASTKDNCCAYCGYAVVKREVTPKDIRVQEKFGEELEKKKMEALEIYVKDIRHNEKVN